MLQDSNINTLLREGADPKNLVLGLTLHGLNFKLKYPERAVGFKKEGDGEGMPGPYAESSLFWGYNEVRFSTISGRETE
jgi:hypothetical protein